ncbi:hypothetical protein L288_09030 [Sphingobium quisquiliarum P25]|uniref:Cupin type-2 domain-containing protein n=1 Tax=Sphingobium quisquiliarum P25 TaxID=1329909 RepID=T0GVQ7_9SPHN|nr:cupin domain-containing protein [Sphingobium quisquiliarum]EQB08061.1 hypothetical protein L288_09030 [Sphingobium quisquiliarum P25]
MTAAGLPPIRRVVTGHDGDGRAIIRSDDTAATHDVPAGGARFLQIWATKTVPADANDPIDGRELATGHTISSGSVIRIVDILPGTVSPMHRTSSVDYGLVLSGEIELELDGGSVTTLRQGDVAVQRGTMHLWRNSSDTPCRMAFILIEAAPYVHDGQPLPEIHF